MVQSYQFKIGAFDCLSIDDGEFIGSADVLFANAPQQQRDQALTQRGLQPDHLPSTLSCLLISSDDRRILIDTGFGPLAPRAGLLPSTLAQHNVTADQIDTVIITHAHGDHIGGAVDGDGRITYRNATHYLWRDEWDFWTNEENLRSVADWMATAARRCLPSLEPQLLLIDSVTEPLPGVRILPAAGHTPGHTVVEIASEGEKLLYIADAALHPLHITHPDWYAELDHHPERAVATRKALLERAVQEELLLHAFHFMPFPSLGHVIAHKDGWRWQPLSDDN